MQTNGRYWRKADIDRRAVFPEIHAYANAPPELASMGNGKFIKSRGQARVDLQSSRVVLWLLSRSLIKTLEA